MAPTRPTLSARMPVTSGPAARPSRLLARVRVPKAVARMDSWVRLETMAPAAANSVVLQRGRLADRARERWPDLAEVRMRYRAGLAYVDGLLPDGQGLQLGRLRYVGSATRWGLAPPPA